jgi:lysozyme family protein
MASDNFAACMRAVLIYEGGKVDRADDPGGRTNAGVTQATYNAWRRSRALLPMDVYRMADSERDAIYRGQYWDAISGDALPRGIDLVVFDAAVNSGVAQAKKWFAAAGKAGSQMRVIDAFCDMRLAFLKHLTTWRAFGHGWSNRVAGVRALAKLMAVR